VRSIPINGWARAAHRLQLHVLLARLGEDGDLRVSERRNGASDQHSGVADAARAAFIGKGIEAGVERSSGRSRGASTPARAYPHRPGLARIAVPCIRDLRQSVGADMCLRAEPESRWRGNGHCFAISTETLRAHFSTSQSSLIHKEYVAYTSGCRQRDIPTFPWVAFSGV
jgi:hypothetical protein